MGETLCRAYGTLARLRRIGFDAFTRNREAARYLCCKITAYQFGVGCSMRSITRVVTSPVLDTSFRPS